MARRNEASLRAAIAGTVGALELAAGYAAGAVAIAGGRVGRAGTNAAGRAWHLTGRAGHRANSALRVLRGAPPPTRRRPLEFVGAALVGSTLGVATAIGVRRLVVYRPTDRNDRMLVPEARGVQQRGHNGQPVTVDDRPMPDAGRSPAEGPTN
jgi:hypothetical protein